MRTTLTLDDDLTNELREQAQRLRVPFEKFVNDTIRRGIHASATTSETRPFLVEAHDCRLRPGFDGRRFNQLADNLEIEVVARKLAVDR